MIPAFKQIKEQLYIELDKPVYLTEDSFNQWNKHNLGVVVRLIQDNSQMGKRNKLRFTKEALDDIDNMLGIDQFVQATFGIYVGFNIYCYEILGYIVKPKPEYEIGDWVEHNDSKEQAKITHIASKDYDAIEVKFIESGELEIYSLDEMNKEFHTIYPKDVILDFGSGIKGTIRRNKHFKASIKVIYGDCDKGEYHAIDINPLSEPMKSIVIELLKAQEEANE